MHYWCVFFFSFFLSILAKVHIQCAITHSEREMEREKEKKKNEERDKDRMKMNSIMIIEISNKSHGIKIPIQNYVVFFGLLQMFDRQESTFDLIFHVRVRFVIPVFGAQPNTVYIYIFYRIFFLSHFLEFHETVARS